MFSSEERPERAIVVEAIEIDLPSTPLGFIVNELVTNAAKHGKDSISIQASHVAACNGSPPASCQCKMPFQMSFAHLLTDFETKQVF
jgi:hypothetical protein